MSINYIKFHILIIVICTYLLGTIPLKFHLYDKYNQANNIDSSYSVTFISKRHQRMSHFQLYSMVFLELLYEGTLLNDCLLSI